MSLLTLVVVVCIAGAIAYLIHRAPWISPPFKMIAVGILLLVIVILVLNAFGILDMLSGVRVPRVTK